MWLLLLEAFMAMMVLAFIVWWTMSGRRPDGVQVDPAAASEDETVRRPD